MRKMESIGWESDPFVQLLWIIIWFYSVQLNFHIPLQSQISSWCIPQIPTYKHLQAYIRMLKKVVFLVAVN